MKKKIIILGMIVLLALSVVGCGKTSICAEDKKGNGTKPPPMFIILK
ncbi:MAG: hypothetical protein ACRDD7_12535 [Peptostreptococcaceae bacterium]